MRRIAIVPVAVAIAFVAVASAAAPSVGAARKCSNAPILFPDAPELVWVLDGKGIDTTEGAKIEGLADSIESVEVACAESVHRRFGIKSRGGGVVIFTKPGPAAVLRVQVDSVAKLHRAFTAINGKPTAHPAQLGWRDSTGLITVELEKSSESGGWTVVGRHRWLDGAAHIATAKP